MRRTTTNFACIMLLILILSPNNHASSSSSSSSLAFKSIIGFGASLFDTGNEILLTSSSVNPPPRAAALPYGETFFRRPTGRWSDGRLVIDFIAEAVGIPYVQPFFGRNNPSSGGANFAVGGSTALIDSYFAEEGIQIYHPNVSVAAQMSWFKELFLPQFCPTPSDCKKVLEASLVVVGEIGGNDYNCALLQGKSVELVQSSIIPKVIHVITSTIHELIEFGATSLVVSGMMPYGCLALYLTHFITSNQTEYDPKTGCLSRLNTFSQNHNNLLQLEIQHIRLRNPNINIIYADYYNVVMQFYRSPQKYGFSKGGALRACCGSGGPYNFDVTWLCGTHRASTCEDPSLHVSWDGLHFTEAANRLIADALFRGSSLLNTLRAPSSINGLVSNDH